MILFIFNTPSHYVMNKKRYESKNVINKSIVNKYGHWTYMHWKHAYGNTTETVFHEKKQYMRMGSRNDRHCRKQCEAGHGKRISDGEDG
ncbi:hypothetical protein KP17_12095 [Pectobacterium parvum]|nr:hypothetical protein KP17_12095 [Pectobacterium parvum]